MTLPGLNRVHCQRIGKAVSAVQAGAEVALLVENAGELWGLGARLMWRREGMRYVIASGGKQAMETLLPLAQAEFQRQLTVDAEPFLAVNDF
jgi:hypothetical protein